MKTQWEISVPNEEKERIAITYGDPADALQIRKNYALYALPDAVTNWHAVVPLLQSNHWYDITAFYSKRKADMSKENAKLLFEYNQKAFDAAKKMGSLVLYFQGVLLGTANEKTNKDLTLPFVPTCLSFCIWNTLTDAKKGAQAPDHKRAASMTSLWYDGFEIVKYQLLLEINKNRKKLIF